MKRAPRSVEQIVIANSGVASILLALVVLWIDYITGEDVQFPILYVLPVGVAVWTVRRPLAYAMSVVLPLVRVAFHVPWHATQSIPVAAINALIAMVALALYAYLLAKKASETTQLVRAVSTKELQMQRLRAFTKTISATFLGRGAAPGLAEGVAMIYVPPESELALGHQPITQDNVGAEISRFDSALAASLRELETIREDFVRQLAGEEVALIDAHLAMIRDASFVEKCKQRVREDLIKVDQAVAVEVRDLETLLQGLGQEYMRERIADVRDIGRRILSNLRTPGEATRSRLAALPPGTVLVAEELLPSDVFQLDSANVVAIVTERGSPASHVAIMARARSIPVVCDVKDATSLLASGDRMLVDAEAGTVTVAPTKREALRFAARKNRYTTPARGTALGPAQSCTTKDGVRIWLNANIDRADEAHLVLEYRLDGVGLFRSEFLFLDAESPPNLETQSAAYSGVAQMLSPLPVVIRTMDLGGDKIPRFKRSADDMALRMGKRGLAYSLTEKTMFRTQLQAILQAAQGGNVKIMFPMVMSAADLSDACRLVEELAETEQLAERPPIGAMIETPAAVFDIRGILEIVDFVSIGTNDLTHSILAMDRGSQGSPGVLSFLHPGVLRAMEQVVRAAIGQRVPLSVCGEAANDPVAACILVGMGVRNFSMSPFLAARVGHAIRQLTFAQAQNAARDALDTKTPEDVQEIVASALRDIYPEGHERGEVIA